MKKELSRTPCRGLPIVVNDLAVVLIILVGHNRVLDAVIDFLNVYFESALLILDEWALLSLAPLDSDHPSYRDEAHNDQGKHYDYNHNHHCKQRCLQTPYHAHATASRSADTRRNFGSIRNTLVYIRDRYGCSCVGRRLDWHWGTGIRTYSGGIGK